MSELSQGTAPEPNSPQGTQVQPQLSPAQTPPPSGEQQPQTPSVEDLQRQLADARQYETRFKDTQQAYTQSQQELQRLRQVAGALTGQAIQAPSDPLAGDVKFFTDQGYAEKDARSLATYMNQKLAPIQQQQQQFYQATQQQMQASQLLGNMAQQNPTLFPTQQVYDQVSEMVSNFARQGGQLSPEFIEDAAAVANYRYRKGLPQQATPQQLPPQVFAGGMIRTSPGYAPQAQPQNQAMTPEQSAANDLVLKTFNLPKK